MAQARRAFAGPFLLPLAVLVLELCRLWLKCVCKEKSRTSSNGVLSHLRSESVPVHVYRNFEFLPGTGRIGHCGSSGVQIQLGW